MTRRGHATAPPARCGALHTVRLLRCFRTRRATGDDVTAGVAAEVIGLGLPAALELLAMLEIEGVIAQVGTGRFGTRWQLAEGWT